MATQSSKLMLDINANADKATSTIRQLASALSALKSGSKTTVTSVDKLTVSVNKLGTSANTATSRLGKLSNAMSKTNSESKSASNNFGKIGAALAKVGGSIINFQAVVNGMAKALQRSMQYQEMLNLFNVSMQGTTYQVSKLTENMDVFGYKSKSAFQSATLSAQEFAETVSNAMGLDPAEWMQNQGTFMNLITGFGVATESAGLMSEQLTQLGYDIASFNNLPTDQAFLKLQSAMAGELEPLRRIGYDLSVARLEQERLNLGIEKSVRDMNQAEKAELRYYAIMTQLTASHGDMARTLESPANQMRILKAQIVQTSRAIGDMFIPVMMKIIPVAIAVLKVIQKLASALAKVFGFKDTDIDYSNVQYNNANANDDAADSLNNVAKKTKKATKAAKEYKKQLLGFDQINNLTLPDKTKNNPSSSGGNTGGISGGGGLGIELPQYDFLKDFKGTKVDEIVKKIEGMFARVGALIAGGLIVLGVFLLATGNIPLGIGFIVAGATVAVATLASSDGLTNRVKQLFSTLNVIIGASLLAIGVILVSIGYLPIGLGLIIGGATAFATGLAMGTTGSLETKIKKMMQTLTAIVGGALLALGVMLTWFGVLIPGIPLIAAGAASIVASLGMTAKSGHGSTASKIKKMLSTIAIIAGGFLLALGVLLTFFGAPMFGIPLIIAGAASLATGVALSKNGKVVKQIKTSLGKIGKFAKKTFSGVKDNIKNTFKNAKDTVGDFVKGFEEGGLKGALEKWFGDAKDLPAIQLGVEIIDNLKDKISNGLKNLNTTVTFDATTRSDAASTAWSNFKSNWDGIKGKIADFGTNISTKAATLWTNFKTAFKTAAVSGVTFALDFAKKVATLASEKWKDFKGGWDKAKKGGMSFNVYFAKKVADLVRDLWNSFKNAWVNGKHKLGLKVTYDTKAGKVKMAVAKALGLSGWPNFSFARNGGIFTGAGMKKITQYASGGLPGTGEVFIAREAGPEMVGRIGGRSAVMNNNQIVASVASGVAEANATQNALIREQNQLLKRLISQNGGDVVLKVGEVEFGRVSARSINKAQRHTGQLLLEV